VSDSHPIIRNVSARLTLVSGNQVVLREPFLGEQPRVGAGRFAKEVAVMSHGRFRLWQVKGGTRAPIDLTAHNVEKIKRAEAPAHGPGAWPHLGPAPNHPSGQGPWLELVHLGVPYAGRIECFGGRMALHGTDAKTGEPRTIPISDIKQLEVTRRRPEPKPVGTEIEQEPSREVRGEETQKEQVVAVKPTEDRVLVKPIEAETKTASGIYLPETAKEKPVRGEVIATGPGKRLDNGKRAEMSVGVGDTVVYGKYAGTEVEIKGVKHLIIRESELLGVIEG